MKLVKKILSMVLSLMMIFSLVSIVKAADTGYTITAPSNGHTYEVYQVFTGQLTGQGTETQPYVLSNIKPGANFKGEASDVDEALEVLENATGTDNERLAEYKLIVDLDSDPYTTVESGATVNVPAGYYLIKDVEGSQQGKDDAVTLYLMKVVGNVTINPKTDKPTVTKKVGRSTGEYSNYNGTSGWYDTNTVSIGDTVNYRLLATIPDLTYYKAYSLIFHDTMSAGLTYKAKSVSVKLVDSNGNETDVSTDYYNYALCSNTDGTFSIDIAFNDVKSIPNYDKNVGIVVYYEAILNENAVVGESGNPNEVYLQYNNDPNSDQNGWCYPVYKPIPSGPDDDYPDETKNKYSLLAPYGETAKDYTVTYTTEIKVSKVDGDTKNKLTGAEFTLTGDHVFKTKVTRNIFEEDSTGTYYKLKDGTYTETKPSEAIDQSVYEDTSKTYKLNTVTEWVEKSETANVKAYVDDQGYITFTGLGDGEYTLTETDTPAGYNTADPITVTIKSTHDDSVDATPSTTIKWTVSPTEAGAVVVNNFKGATLPSTGGMGTTMIYVTGGLLMAAAIILLVSKKRMVNEG